MKTLVTNNSIDGVRYYHREKPFKNGGVFHQLWAYDENGLCFMDSWWS